MKMFLKRFCFSVVLVCFVFAFLSVNGDEHSNSIKDLGSSAKSNQLQSCSDLSGKWYNQHGSEIQLTPGSDLALSGSFSSAVDLYKEKKSTTEPVKGRLVGYLQPDGSFGFAVKWENASNQTTAYSGNCYADENGEVLVSAWHLAEKQKSIADAWKSFRTGQDIFTRTKRMHHRN